MKNIVSKLALAAVLAAGFAGQAFADVDAVASIDKTKKVSVIENISIDKDVTLNLDIGTADVELQLARAAEASAIANITTSNNLVDRVPVVGDINGNALPHQDNIRAALIGGNSSAAQSINDNDGLTGVNQDVGAMTNQGNLWSVALSEENPTDPSLFADAQAEVDQKSIDNEVSFVNGEGAASIGGQIDFNASIDGSINDNTGLTAVNQNAGNMNNQTNAVAVAAGVSLVGNQAEVSGASVALAEAALGQVSTGNDTDELDPAGALKTSTISGSINGNIGITQVNQATSNMGNQGNVVAAGAAVLGL